jgi:hypothetical protein
MISTEKYEKLLTNGLSLDHYHVLSCIYRGDKLPNLKRIKGFFNYLTMKGYLLEGILTEQAIDLVQDEVYLSSTTTTTTVVEGNFNYNDWVLALHGKIQNKIMDLTGKIQVRDKIQGKSYSFLCNSTDLGKNLQKVIKLYKLDSRHIDSIESALLKHVEDCNRARNWFPVIYYYIFKDGKSQLVTDLDNIEELSTEGKNVGDTYI